MNFYLSFLLFFGVTMAGHLDAQEALMVKSVADHPCLIEMYQSLEPDLAEVVDTASISIIGYFTIGDNCIQQYDSLSVYSNSSKSLDTTSLVRLFKTMETLDLCNCVDLPDGKLVFPITLHHRIWDAWYPGLASEFRTNEVAREEIYSNMMNSETTFVSIVRLNRPRHQRLIQHNHSLPNQVGLRFDP